MATPFVPALFSKLSFVPGLAGSKCFQCLCLQTIGWTQIIYPLFFVCGQATPRDQFRLQMSLIASSQRRESLPAAICAQLSATLSPLSLPLVICPLVPHRLSMYMCVIIPWCFVVEYGACSHARLYVTLHVSLELHQVATRHQVCSVLQYSHFVVAGESLPTRHHVFTGHRIQLRPSSPQLAIPRHLPVEEPCSCFIGLGYMLWPGNGLLI